MGNNNNVTEFQLVLYVSLRPLVGWIEAQPKRPGEFYSFIFILRRSLIMILRYIEKRHPAAVAQLQGDLQMPTPRYHEVNTVNT